VDTGRTTNLVLTLDGWRTSREPDPRPASQPRRTADGLGAAQDAERLERGSTRLVSTGGASTATLYRRGRVILRAPVGVGQPSWPTPRGEFYIRNQLYGFGNPVYGPVAFGTSAR
jgi:hypothetical protein